MTPIPFVIWFHSRSGSTHLVSLLDSHPDIACFPEIFYEAEGSGKNLFHLSGVHQEEEFLEHFFSYRWGPGGASVIRQTSPPKRRLLGLFRRRKGSGVHGSPSAVGFKLKYRQADDYPKVYEYLLKHRHRIKVIHLIRENLLASIASSVLCPRVLDQFGDWNIPVYASLGDFNRTVRLEPGAILEQLETLKSLICRSRNAVSCFDVLEVTYEDLVFAENTTSQRLLQFLGVNEAVTLSSQFRKIMPHCLRDSVENFEEIRCLLNGSKFSYLVEGCA